MQWFIKISLASGGGGGLPGTGPLPNPLGSCTAFSCIFTPIINFLIDVAYPLLAIMVLVGGIMLMTAGGDEKRISTGKKTLMWAVIGFAVVLIANGVTNIVKSIL